jgi:hypothetical protein
MDSRDSSGLRVAKEAGCISSDDLGISDCVDLDDSALGNGETDHSQRLSTQRDDHAGQPIDQP